MRPQTFSVLVAVALTRPPVWAQSLSDTVRFEVASVRPAAARSPNEVALGTMRGGPGTVDPERITYRAVTLLQVLRRAYGITNDFQILGGPGWFTELSLDSPRFDIIANVPPGTSKEQFNVMLQNLLAERFALKLHHETKELPVYALVIAKNGPKLKEVAAKAGAPAGLTILPRDGGFLLKSIGAGVAVSVLINALRGRLSSVVVDRTGLTGTYEFNLAFADDAPTVADVPPLPTLAEAIEQDLGLTLEKSKADFDVLVVDHIEKTATGN